MQVENLASQVDALVSKGMIIDAVDTFFDPRAKTRDFDGTVTTTKEEMIQKMQGFLGAIKNVNGITLHQASSGENISMSEYTFDFDMKDGSRILWHEVIRREWQQGLIVDEKYFKN